MKALPVFPLHLLIVLWWYQRQHPAKLEQFVEYNRVIDDLNDAYASLPNPKGRWEKLAFDCLVAFIERSKRELEILRNLKIEKLFIVEE